MKAQPLDDDGMRRLWAAIILRGVRDAQHGDTMAAQWLIDHAALWAADVVAVDFNKLAHIARDWLTSANTSQ